MDELNHILRYPLNELPFVFIALVVAFTIHEFAHAYSAYRFGDPTAKNLGRVTLDPRKHLDVVGTILIFLAGFGWARPVPVNRHYFKSPRLMGVVVSAVGPLSNLAIAFTTLLIYYFMLKNGFHSDASGTAEAIYLLVNIMIHLNIILFIFNLIPIPPLDGYRIIQDLVPNRHRAKLSQYEHWGVFVFLLLVFIPPLYNATILPLFNLEFRILSGMARLLQLMFG